MCVPTADPQGLQQKLTHPYKAVTRELLKKKTQALPWEPFVGAGCSEHPVLPFPRHAGRDLLLVRPRLSLAPLHGDGSGVLF